MEKGTEGWRSKKAITRKQMRESGSIKTGNEIKS